MSKLRCSTHDLAIETGRHHNVKREHRLCMYCNIFDIEVVEDEYHFLASCPLYADLRDLYIPLQFTKSEP